jgi:hypothetical protein
MLKKIADPSVKISKDGQIEDSHAHQVEDKPLITEFEQIEKSVNATFSQQPTNELEAVTL